MTELIESGLVESTVSTSRTMQESFQIQRGEEKYIVLAGCMNITKDQATAFSKFAGSLAGDAAMVLMRRHDYHDEKNGKLRNFINRNFYQDAFITKEKQSREELVGVCVNAVTQLAARSFATGLYNYETQKANYKMVDAVYGFLRNYALSDSDSDIEKEKVEIELAKIRNGLPLSDKEIKEICKKYKEEPIRPLKDISSLQALNTNKELPEALAYQIFDLYCQKYGDNKGELAVHLENRDWKYKGMNELLQYYDYLGYTGIEAEEMIRENANRYDTISRDQNYYLQFGRKMILRIGEMMDMGKVDMNQIINHTNMMVQYDPYRLRRRAVQNVGIGIAEGFGGLLERKPDVVFNGLSLALSSFRLEDGNVAEIVERECERNGITKDTFGEILNQVPLLTSGAKKANKLKEISLEKK